jgi:hypothetical protein
MSTDWVDLWLADAPREQVVAAFRDECEAHHRLHEQRRTSERRAYFAARRHTFQRAVLADALHAKTRNLPLIRGLRKALRRDGEERANRGYDIASADSQALSREAIAALQMLAEVRGLYLIVGQHQTRLRNLDTPLSRDARLSVATAFRTLVRWSPRRPTARADITVAA